MRLGLRLGQASQAFLHHYHNQPQPTVVYLKHVKWITGKLQLEEHFRQYGEIREIYQFFDPNTGFHRGFASITFASRDAAEKAKLAGEHYIDGGKVVVQSDQPMNQMKHTQFSQAASNNYKVINIRANPKMANIGPKNMSISSQQPTPQPKQIEAATKSATAATPGPANSGAVLPPSAEGAGDDSGGSKKVTKQQQMDATVKKGSFEH